MSWTIFEERPIYWQEPPEQIAITNVETGEHDAYILTSAATKRIRELKEYVSLLEAKLRRGECHDTGEYVSAFECSACGEVYEMWRDPDYCPGCGRRVVDDRR